MKIGVRTFRNTKALNMSGFREQIRKAMNEDVKDHYIKQFSAIVKPWNSDIPFGSSVSVKLDSVSIYVFPIGEHKMKFIWVDLGTRPHKIEGSPLFLPYAKYTNFTTPTAMYSNKGGYLTGKWKKGASKHYIVEHPGIRPRLFSQDIALDEDNKRVFNNAIRRAIRRTVSNR